MRERRRVLPFSLGGQLVALMLASEGRGALDDDVTRGQSLLEGDQSEKEEKGDWAREGEKSFLLVFFSSCLAGLMSELRFQT